MGKRLRHLTLLFFCSALCALLSGCKMAVLDPKGVIAAAERDILITSVVLMLIVVIPVILLSLFFAWRYRASNTKAVYAPNWSHSTLLELIWWSIPCVITVILAAITWTSTHALDPYKPIESQQKTLTIQAIALEWKWLFIYPEQNIASVNFVQFPVGVPVKFLITSEGPMNSLLIPQLAGQIYAMAGMQSKLHIMASEAGDYRGISSNYSGDGFSEMKFIARASTQAEFDAWVKKVKLEPKQLSASAYNQLMLPSTANPVQTYSAANQHIFNTVVMKSMMPMKLEEGASHA